MIEVSKICESEFAEIRSEWNDLLERSGLISPMLTWEWMFTWWEHYQSNKARRDLYLMSARSSGGELVGIAPFLVRTVREMGIRSTRIEFLGTGEAVEDETCSEMLDLIISRDHIDECVSAFAGQLREDPGWDELVCRDVRTDRESSVSKMVRSMETAPGLRTLWQNQGKCPWIRLPLTAHSS